MLNAPITLAGALALLRYAEAHHNGELSGNGLFYPPFGEELDDLQPLLNSIPDCHL
jgi:hypothetical protein